MTDNDKMPRSFADRAAKIRAMPEGCPAELDAKILAWLALEPMSPTMLGMRMSEHTLRTVEDRVAAMIGLKLIELAPVGHFRRLSLVVLTPEG